MPTKESMQDLTRIIEQLEELERIAITGEIPDYTIETMPDFAPRLSPYIAGGTLECVRQLAYHVKQLQLDIVALTQQCDNRHHYENPT
jgi:hypothetical protein